MTNYNERLYETLARYITYSDGFGAYIIDENAMPKLEQALTSLIKELVAEQPNSQLPLNNFAKQGRKRVYVRDYGYFVNDSHGKTYWVSQNLLKALEEVE